MRPAAAACVFGAMVGSAEKAAFVQLTLDITGNIKICVAKNFGQGVLTRRRRHEALQGVLYAETDGDLPASAVEAADK